MLTNRLTMKTPKNKKQHKEEGPENINGTLRIIEQQLDQAADKYEDSSSDYDFEAVENEDVVSSDDGNDDDTRNNSKMDGGGSDDSREIIEESDSSEDEVAPRNTVGSVPLEWYKDEEHIGYNLAGKKIKKKERQNKLDSFLASADDSKSWRKIYDEYNDEEVELTKGDTKLIRRLLEGKAPHADFDPYQPYVEFFAWDDSKHPLSNAPEPKRRFIPSKWESKKVLELVRAFRMGRIKFDDKPKEESNLYDVWADDSSLAERQGLAHIPAPKFKLPGHEESFNPSGEYIPSQEEINALQLIPEEDRPKFIAQRFKSYRSVPAFDKAVSERFGRCLDLYLCPRARKKRINIDPETLKPKLPSRKDLKPYPTTCYLEYKGHKGPVISVTAESTGQWIASGSNDGSVRVWEVETGRCLRVWDIGEPVQQVVWNPLPELPLLAIAAGQDVFILKTGLESEEEQKKIEELLRIETPTAPDDSDKNASFITWGLDEKHGGIRLKHFKTVSSLEWHRKGDYLSTLMPHGESRSVLIHQLSKKLTQRIPYKLRGLPVSSAFHPNRSIFFISTKKDVRVFDLLKQKLLKKLEPGVREVSSIGIHPGGDNVIVGSKDGKLCWFDMDLSSHPYKVLKPHKKDISKVSFHHSYPLFSSCSDDCTAYVFHGKVYSDLNQNPLIVPLEILRGHASADGRGVLDCKFHPRQPWLFTAGADSVIRLYCH
ncbi:ribosome biogenesis BOP1 homolog isoform X2 [Olea europaea subsp. europaea]|uniref:Ribosome biogenesis protein BOP1 homolog n=1 Tax=Olea europaea subsp. europaea TaxID=158383 RepID=A0A8S0VGT9_OLEEU|nr:ribosome biogenesis BOP1 homolog isoform X2 [Olea europaea subsp. europaea]